MPPPERDLAMNASQLHRPSAAGALAAELLKDSCDSALESQRSLHFEAVRDAALDLGRHLEALADSGEAVPVNLLAEGALRCADLSNLAACAIPELPAEAVPAAVAAAHLSAGAARALQPLVEAASGEMEEDRTGYALRDARNAAWRANLVVQQVEEATSAGSRGVAQDE